MGMNWNKFKIYGKTLSLKRGCSITLMLCYNCTLSCDYCCLKIASGKYPVSKMSTFDEWKELINRWPVKIKEVILSGGEPTLMPYFAELANWLLDKGYHVKVYSNLTNPKPYQDVRNSYRFIITATYHHSYDINKFIVNLSSIKHRIDVHEIDSRMLPFSKVKELVTDKWKVETRYFRVNPARKIFIGCYDLTNYGTD
jgi:organic radical activating enzyme